MALIYILPKSVQTSGTASSLSPYRLINKFIKNIAAQRFSVFRSLFFQDSNFILCPGNRYRPEFLSFRFGYLFSACPLPSASSAALLFCHIPIVIPFQKQVNLKKVSKTIKKNDVPKWYLSGTKVVPEKEPMYHSFSMQCKKLRRQCTTFFILPTGHIT